MKKILSVFVILLVVLAAGYCAASWWVGTQAQKQYESLLAQKTHPLLQVTIKSYERGIFRSTAVTSVVVKKPGEGSAGGEAIRFSLINSFQHGPLVFADNPHISRSFQPVQAVITTRLVREGEVGELLGKALEKVPELGSSEALTILYLDGSGESYLDIPKFKRKLTDDKGGDFTIEWGGLNVKSRFDLTLTEVTGSLTAPSWAMEVPEFNIAMKALKGDFGAHAGLKGLNVGTLNLSCESVEVKPAGEGAPFRLESPGIQTGTGVSGETITGSFLARFNKVVAEGENYGPFAFELELRKLDPATLAAFQQSMKELQAMIGVKSDEEVKQFLEASYTKLLTGLISKSPEIELKELKGVTPLGDFSAHAKVAIAESGGSIIENPLLALTSLSANVDAAVSERLLVQIMRSSFGDDSQTLEEGEDPAQAEEAAAKKATSVIETLISEKLIVREKETLKANASYGQGKLVVNGRDLNLNDLLKVQ